MTFTRLALIVCVAASCAGCVTETKTVAMSADRVSNLKNVKPAEAPQQELKPETLVAAGRLQESVADDAKTPSLQQSECRDLARKYYERAFELNPKCIDAYLALAKLYLKQQDYDRAIGIYQKGAKINPSASILWYEEGLVFLHAKDFTHAMACLGKAHELDPKCHIYATQCGLCLARAGLPQEGLQVLCSVMNKADAYYSIARMMEHLNEPERCRQYLQMALQERPTHESAHLLMARLDAPRGPQPALGQPNVEDRADTDVRSASWTERQ